MPREGALSSWIMPWNSEGLCNESVRRSVELASMASGEWSLRQRREASTRPRSRRRTLIALSILGMAGGMLASLWEFRFVRHAEAGRPAAERPGAERRVDADRAKSVALHAAVLLPAWAGGGAFDPVLAAAASVAGAGVAVRALGRPPADGGLAWAGCALADVLSHVAACAWALSAAGSRPGLSEA